jgi:hypothetical protein
MNKNLNAGQVMSLFLPGSYCSFSTNHQTRMEMALVVTHLLWLPILCHQLVQKVRSCLDHQEKQHGKYHEYPSRYSNNGNFSTFYYLYSF